MIENILKIDENQIHFIGFSQLKSSVTFGFLPSGVSITDGNHKTEDYHYLAEIQEDRTIKDVSLIDLLYKNNIPESSNWACLNNTYYKI